MQHPEIRQACKDMDEDPNTRVELGMSLKKLLYKRANHPDEAKRKENQKWETPSE